MLSTLITAFPERLDATEATATLAAAGSVARVHYGSAPPTEDELLELLCDADALIAGGESITERVLQAAPRLQIIARTGVGVDAIDLDAARHFGIRVTITPGLTSGAVADLTMGLLLCLARRLCAHDRAMRSGCWDRSIDTDLGGKVLGIIGLGSIGRLVAKRSQAFDMLVVACDPVPDEAFAAAHDIPYLEVDELLERSDAVTLHVPLTSRTKGIIGHRELRLMKPTAYLINTARGSLVDEPALVQSLREGWIAGAGLDVFPVEPPPCSPLLQLPNVVLTPHMGAWTKDTWAAMARQAALEVARVLRGEPPLHAIV